MRGEKELVIETRDRFFERTIFSLSLSLDFFLDSRRYSASRFDRLCLDGKSLKIGAIDVKKIGRRWIFQWCVLLFSLIDSELKLTKFHRGSRNGGSWEKLGVRGVFSFGFSVR